MKLTNELPDELTAEQKRRIEIFEQYDKEAGPARAARNKAIEEFELSWREKTILLMSEQEKSRFDAVALYSGKGLSPMQAQSATAFDLAKGMEDHMLEKDTQARKLDTGLEKPKSWKKFLEEENERSPGDPVVAVLMKEAQACDHDLAVGGFLKTPAPERLLSSLAMVQDSDGATAFKRGTSTVFRDVGPRLDVQRTDRQDIAAALKVAAQKFDQNKGLMLTGDTQFKVMAAEVAGQMGLKLRNTEPEVLHAWERGRKQLAELLPSRAPSVERGIEGDMRLPGIDRVSGEQLLRVDAGLLRTGSQALQAAGVEFVAVGKNDNPATLMMASGVMLKLPEGRTEAALAAWRGLPKEAAEALAKADLSKPDGALKLSDEQKVVLVERQMIDANGNLKPAGIDVVLVRDDHILRSRDDPAMKQTVGEGAGLKTSAEFVRQAAGELDKPGQQQTTREGAEKAQQKVEAAEVPLERDEPVEREAEREREPDRKPEQQQRKRRVLDLDVGR